MKQMKVTKLIDSWQGLKFPESPRWHEGKLWFLDIHDHSIKRADINGVLETVLELPFLPNSLGFMPDGNMFFGDALQRRIYIWNGREYKQWVDISSLAKNCLSDGIADSLGRIYVGDIGYDFLAGEELAPEGVIVLVGTEGQAAIVAEKLTFPNGMVITPDGKTLIVAETYAHRLIAFDIQEDGKLDNRRIFAEFNEDITPDGICLDADGAIWVATVGSSVVRVREGGEITHQVVHEDGSYAVMLGGPDRKNLFICISRSHDPKEVHQNPSARIEFVKTDVAGAGIP